jgi:hypothetical protein
VGLELDVEDWVWGLSPPMMISFYIFLNKNSLDMSFQICSIFGMLVGMHFTLVNLVSSFAKILRSLLFRPPPLPPQSFCHHHNHLLQEAYLHYLNAMLHVTFAKSLL